ncbi:MAG: GAF domain-containing protein [Spirochaetales bacterium]|nr:GAF domain-containing protein [Spirochaetales bacterium]
MPVANSSFFDVLSQHFLALRIGRDGIILAVNDLYYQTTLTQDQNLVGFDVAAMLDMDMPLEDLIALKTALARGQTWSGTIRSRGLFSPASIRSFLFPEEGTDSMLLIGFDTTADVEMYEASRENSILFEILHDSYYFHDMQRFYESMLERIVTVPWLEFTRSAGIMLADLDTMDELKLVASYNLRPELKAMCARVPFGHCLCGRTALKREILFKSCIDEDHENRYNGISPHGHYNVPLIYQDRLLGVLFLYVSHGHEETARERSFLERLAGILASAIAQRESERERDFAMQKVVELQQTIQRYTPRSLWYEAGSSMEKGISALPAHSRIMSFLFLDIKGFTHLSESLAPQEVIALLNEYFSPTTDIILSQEGEIERFMGDGIFASFGMAPSAARAALRIAKLFRETNISREGKKQLHFRMGIHTGNVIQGNVGSHSRMEYTMIGDAVNLASRLESNCMTDRILISEVFYKAGEGDFLAHEPFSITVKGKSEPITVRYLYGYRHLSEHGME